MNRMPKLIGLDLGFGFTKCTDGQRSIIFQSHMRGGIADGRNEREPAEGIHAIQVDEKDYTVGDDAGGSSLFEDFARRPDRLFKAYGRHLVLTALAPFSNYETPMYAVVGLPVAYFRQWETQLQEELTGYHKIGIYQADHTCTRKNIYLSKIHVVPHPLGTFTNLIMDCDGRFRSSDYTRQKVALVDIGFRTTDVIVMDAGRLCNRGCRTIEMGMANGFESIARRLRHETDLIPDLNRLYKAIRRGFIRIEDQEYNLKNLRAETYQWLATALADRINDTLKDDWDLECVVLTGGGATDIGEDLAPRLDGNIVMIEHAEDMRLSNAEGQLSLARHMWGATGLCESNRR